MMVKRWCGSKQFENLQVVKILAALAAPSASITILPVQQYCYNSTASTGSTHWTRVEP